MAKECEWMFGDVATGPFGFAEFAHLNPARWSGGISFSEAIDDFEELINIGDGERPVIFKIPPNTLRASSFHPNVKNAIEHIQSKRPPIKALVAADEAEARKDAADAEKRKAAAEADRKLLEERIKAGEKEVENAEMLLKNAKEIKQLKEEEVSAAKSWYDKKKNELHDAKTHAKEKVSAKNARFYPGYPGAASSGGNGEGANVVRFKGKWVYADQGSYKSIVWSKVMSGVKLVNELAEAKTENSQRAIIVRHSSNDGQEQEERCESIDAAILFVQRFYPEIKDALDAENALPAAEQELESAETTWKEAELKRQESEEQVLQFECDVTAKKQILELRRSLSSRGILNGA